MNVTLPNMYSLCKETLSNIFIDEQELLDIISLQPGNNLIDPGLVSQKCWMHLFFLSQNHSKCYLIDLCSKLFLKHVYTIFIRTIY